MSQHFAMYGSFFFALAVLAAVGVWVVLRSRKSPEEKEQLRREMLVHYGRMTDGTVLDYSDHEIPIRSRKKSKTAETSPTRMLRVLHYRYEIAGVIYESNQDVTFHAELCTQLVQDGSFLDMPASIRYDTQNPANSIVVAETWNGLYSRRFSNQVSAEPSDNGSNNVTLNSDQ